MPLYIKDDEVDLLADRLVKAIGARTKTEAVRNAIITRLKIEEKKPSLSQRLADVQDKAALLGPLDPDFDMAACSNVLWKSA